MLQQPGQGDGIHLQKAAFPVLLAVLNIKTVLPVLLGLVKRQVRRLVKMIEVQVAAGGDADPHAGCDGDARGVAQGQLQRLANLLPLHLYRGLRNVSGQKGDELVAAQPAQYVLGPEQPREHLRRLAHRMVSGQMAQGVVDPLKIVQVNDQQCAHFPVP